MSEPKVLLFATRNAGKVAELRELTAGLPIEVRSLDGLDLAEVVEDGDTFAANAIKKALAVSEATGLPALADDSLVSSVPATLAPTRTMRQTMRSSYKLSMVWQRASAPPDFAPPSPWPMLQAALEASASSPAEPAKVRS